MKFIFKIIKTLKCNAINFLIFCLFTSTLSLAQTTYYWDASALPATSGSNANITSAAFVNPQGNNFGTTTQITTTSASNTYTSPSAGSNFGAATKIGALSTSSSTYFSTIITPATSYGVQLNSISFGSRSTATGPQLISIYSSIDNYTSSLGSVVVSNNSIWALSTITFSTGIIGLASTPVTLRLYGSGGSGTAAINTANWRIDDIQLNITPMTPPTITSLSASAGCLGQSLIITGTNLTGATAANVKIGGVAVSSITSNSGTSMVVVVGSSCSGTVTVTTANGPAISAGTYVAGATATYNSGWVAGITPDVTKEIVFLTDYTASSNLSGCSCTITNGNVVIPSMFNLTLVNQLTVTNSALTSFTLENNASLIQSNSSTTINSGDINVRRESSMLKNLDYTLWSSPVVGTQTLLNFSPSTSNVAPSNIRFYTYDTANDRYQKIGNSTTSFTGSTTFARGAGYLIRVPTTHPTTPSIWSGQFIGVPNNGTFTTPITYVDATKFYNVIGNPYPSPIDMASFVSANSSNINGTLRFWRKTNSVTTNTGYSSWNAGIFTAGPYFSSSFDPLGVIQTGQGFMVEAKSGATSVTFNNLMRLPNSTNQFFRNANNSVETNLNFIWLNLTGNNDMFSQMAVGYRANATDGLDDFDATSFNDGQISLSSFMNSKNFVIQAKSLPFSQSDVIPLSLKVPVDGNYKIAIDRANGLFVGGNQSVYLHDLFTNSYTNLNLGSYDFATTAGTFNNRFEITYTNNALNNSANDFNENGLIVYKNNNEIVINSGNNLILNVKIYDLQGRLLVDKNNSNTNEIRLNVNSANQIYLVKTTLSEGQIITKKIIN